jgi:sulfite exporter TauE/SafE
MADSFVLLCGTAASVGLVHTVLGPDHYLPFVAMSRAGNWSVPKTLVVTLLCGVGHVLSSVVLGLIGIAFGVAVLKLETIEGVRGDLAGWLLLAFGFVYFVWGVRLAIRNKPHTHWHAHADGTMHEHTHVHAEEHVHAHDTVAVAERVGSEGQAADGGGHGSAQGRSTPSMTPWILFTIFVFGPCEPLIPIVMYPAAKGNMFGVVVVALIFGFTTIGTMTAAVLLGRFAVGRLPFGGLARYSHAVAGFVVLLCGAAIKVGL